MMNRQIVLVAAVVVSISAYAVYSGLFPMQEGSESTVLDVPAGNNKLAIEFYKQISNSSENIFFSPPALYATLAALYEGADGDAAAQIQKLLSLETDTQKRHDAISEFLSDIYRHDPHVRPEMAGVLWLPDGSDVRDEYQKTVKSYGLDVKSGISEEMIDGWATKETNGRITDVVDSGNLDTNAAVITNVADFEGEWLHHFGPRGTVPFAVNAEEYVLCDFMNQRHYYEAALFSNVYVIKIPYKNERLSMITIGPRIHDINFFEESLTLEMIEQWKAEMQRRDRVVGFPKFEIKSSYSLKEPLANLGVTGIFDSDANLGGITGSRNLHISEIFQKSFINITESGTDTPFNDAPGTLAEELPEGPNLVHFEPFIFIIQDDKTGAILFMGRVIDPTA